MGDVVCGCDVRQEHTNKVGRQSVQDGYKTSHGVWCRIKLEIEGGEEIVDNLNVHVAVGKRKDKTTSCEKCSHLERGTHVGTKWQNSSERTGRDGLDTCKGEIKMRPRERYYR